MISITSRLVRVSAALGLACLLLVAVSSLFRASAQECSQTHIVTAGENLNDIAKRYNTTVDALVERNHLSSVHSLYAGQQLCVSTLPPSLCGNDATTPRPGSLWPPTPGTTSSGPQIALEATFVYTPANPDERGWLLSPLIGVRSVLPIDPGSTAIHGYTTTDTLRQAARDCPNVVLWVAGPPHNAALASVGDPAILQALNLAREDNTAPLSGAFTNVKTLRNFERDGDMRVQSLTIWLEAPAEDGRILRIPIDIGQVAHFATASQAASQMTDARLVLLKQSNGLFRVGVVLGARQDGSSIYGPPGANRALRCTSWPSRGWRYRFLRRINGC